MYEGRASRKSRGVRSSLLVKKLRKAELTQLRTRNLQESTHSSIDSLNGNTHQSDTVDLGYVSPFRPRGSIFRYRHLLFTKGILGVINGIKLPGRAVLAWPSEIAATAPEHYNVHLLFFTCSLTVTALSAGKRRQLSIGRKGHCKAIRVGRPCVPL